MNPLIVIPAVFTAGVVIGKYSGRVSRFVWSHRPQLQLQRKFTQVWSHRPRITITRGHND